MTIKELHSMNFNDAAAKLEAEHDDVTSYEMLKEFAKNQIDNEHLFLAIHILEAINNDPADYYDYDYCMGTLETPTSLLVIADLEEYCEEE